MRDLMANTICDYIKLAEEEVYECMKHDLECDEISIEGAQFIHYCLENIKHLEMLKKGMVNHEYSGEIMYTRDKDEKDIRMHNGDIEVHDAHSHKSAFGGV